MRRQPKQRRSAHDVKTGLRQKRVEARSVARAGSRGVRAPCVIRKRASADGERRTGHGPGSERGAQLRPARTRTEREAEPQSGKPIGLAEGAQHNEALILRETRDARFRREIHEGFIDDQQTAALRHLRGGGQNVLRPDDASVRIIGIDDHANVGVRKRVQCFHRIDLRAHCRPAGGVLGVSEAENRDAFGRENARQHLNEGLRAAAWNDVGSGGRAIGLARSAVERGESVIVG